MNPFCEPHGRFIGSCGNCHTAKARYWYRPRTLADELNDSEPDNRSFCANRADVVSGSEVRQPRARLTDPETSHEAAALLNIGALEAQVIQWLQDHGPQTQKEISLGTGIPEISCSPILRPLARALILWNPPERRTNPGTGRSAIAWAVIEY